jgi:myo-inositol-1(or 4)-monophosphatase
MRFDIRTNIFGAHAIRRTAREAVYPHAMTSPQVNDQMLLDELCALATELACRAGAYLLDGVTKPRTSLETKSSPTDQVSEMDRGAETMIVEGILAARPNDAIVGEEGTNRAGTTGIQWVIDPLDGTTNYLYGNPMWSVSIGVVIDGLYAIGVVDAPTLRETFVGVTGRGATCNGKRVAVSACSDPAVALVGTGFGYDPARRAWQGQLVAGLLPRIRDLRRGGSAAIDLAFVSCGRLDAMFERGLNPWDMAAGVVLIREAGGIVTDVSGREEPNESMLIAASPGIHARLRTLIEGVAPANPV